jgi:hypothetical protein
MKLIQPGNSKLPGMLMFNLPANYEVCNRTCKGCYAMREEQRFPSVKQARQLRYEAALQPDFASRIKAELNAKRKLPKHFRIHSSGEFFSQPYVNAWVSIAKAFPQVTFYTYTKRIKDFDFSAFKALPNTVLINSFHYGGLNYGTLNRAPKNAVICPHQKGSSVVCGQSCTKCMSKSAEQTGIFFIKH